MKIAVTGVNGFVGRHLAEQLNGVGHEVIGFGMEPDPASSRYLSEYVSCDLTNEDAVKTALPQFEQCGAIINLAGIAITHQSPEAAERTIKINVATHEVPYKLLKAASYTGRIVAVSSGYIYETDQPMPLVESSRLQKAAPPTNPYVISKLRAEDAAHTYQKDGLNIIIARPFNHTGPGQKGGFFVPDQFIKIKNAQASGETLRFEPKILDFWRDITDVRDVVNAYILLATSDALSANIYNIASGQAQYGVDMFQSIAAVFGFTNYTIEPVASSDAPKIMGSAALLQRDTGWQPHIPFEQTIKDMAAEN